MITDELLLENNYKKHKDIWNNADSLFQKRVKDDKGTKYFINIYKYTFPLHNKPDYTVELAAETENYAIEITLFYTKGMSLEDIENEIEKIWQSLNLDYYEED